MLYAHASLWLNSVAKSSASCCTSRREFLKEGTGDVFLSLRFIEFCQFMHQSKKCRNFFNFHTRHRRCVLCIHIYKETRRDPKSQSKHNFIYLYCCTVHLVDSLIITQPTNALIVCHLFLNHLFKTLFTAPTCFDSISLIIIREHI